MAHPGRPRNHDPIADDIRRAIRNGEDAEAIALIDKCEADIPDGDARTPLIWAAFHNRIQLLDWLIDSGASVDQQDRIGYCALHFAAQEKHAEIAARLLATGASSEQRDIYGNTPLWTAIFSAAGDLRVVRLLFEHGADLDNKNKAGKTIREMAGVMIPDLLAEFTQAT